jgi:dienelactone hydrolase
MSSRPAFGGFTAFLCVVGVMLMLPRINFARPETTAVQFDRFDLSQVPPVRLPARPQGLQITDYAVEYVVDLGVPDGEPGHDSEVRVVLPTRRPNGKVPTLIVNGAGAYLFSGMVLSDEDIEPLLPYVERGFAVVAYETDGCQPDFERDPTPADIIQMTRRYVASKAGLVNATRALDFALNQFPEIDSSQLYTLGHSSGGKQALLLAAHDHRIKGCVAFAPACKLDNSTSKTLSQLKAADQYFLTNEVKRSMPIAHAKVTKVPILLIYSQSDRITRPSEVIGYAKAVGQHARIIPLQGKKHWEVPGAGFNVAIAWFRTRGTSNLREIGRNVNPNGMPRNLNGPAQISSPVQLQSNPFAD